MPNGIGNFISKKLTSVPSIHRWINKVMTSKYADPGPLPGLYTTKHLGMTSLRELLEKERFALEVPTPDAAHLDSLPDIQELRPLFERKGPAKESRVSALLPFFAQHLTDAVFQSADDYATNAPHEIILNQIYGNTREDETALRSGVGGKLQTQTKTVNGREVEYPDALFEKSGRKWTVKDRYAGLSYLQEDGRIEKLLDRYKDREDQVCATGLFQGNLTLGNFAITALMVREHNRLCDGIAAELAEKGLDTSDEAIFRTAQQNNIVAYMKVVLEDYINTFAGQKLFILDTKTFFYEAKRWWRETPLVYHFNILYRIHSMIPDALKGMEELGYEGMKAQNGVVMEAGLGKVFQIASNTAAGQARLGNTHANLVDADLGGATKARKVLGSFNAHRRSEKMPPANFLTFDPEFREQLRTLYSNDPNKVDYAVGILAEPPEITWLERLGIKDDPILGPTLNNAIAKHAFRHILSNRFMSREYLNAKVMTTYGWRNLLNTSTVADIVKRNVGEEMDQAEADALRISFVNPAFEAS